ncbi:hypothetical protein [Streptomyces sp. NPDC007172]|uniref:hypothetical protein n=1 Tax=Streptomyces sp. NPDC007172 TaxID=3364776 RepID=UPI0036B3D3BE
MNITDHWLMIEPANDHTFLISELTSATAFVRMIRGERADTLPVLPACLPVRIRAVESGRAGEQATDRQAGK